MNCSKAVCRVGSECSSAMCGFHPYSQNMDLVVYNYPILQAVTLSTNNSAAKAAKSPEVWAICR